jgi:glycosyltransferase involved in cell wall biosynthesis
MHVLMLSYDKALVVKNNVGDALQRHRHYATYLDRLDVVVPVPQGEQQPAIKVNEKLTIYPSHGSKPLAWLRAYQKARAICRIGKVDIIITQDALLGCLGVLLRREFKSKLIVNAFALDIFSDVWLEENRLHRLYKILMCWALRRADLIRTDGTKDRMSLIVKLQIPPQKVVTLPIVPSPESIQKFTQAKGAAVRESLLGSTHDKLVLFVGMLNRQKNIPNLLKAVKSVLTNRPRTLFIIIGDGPERRYLEKMSQELDIKGNVHFLGLVAYDVLPDYYAACDVFVLPSWYEGFARVLMEAAFSRKPIVATDVSGVSDLIEDGQSGYIVEVNSPEQLADRIERLLDNPEMALQIGTRGYERVREYCDFDKNIRKLIGIWEGLLTAHRA